MPILRDVADQQRNLDSCTNRFRISIACMVCELQSITGNGESIPRTVSTNQDSREHSILYGLQLTCKRQKQLHCLLPMS